MNAPHRLAEAVTYFSTPENCLSILIRARWKDGVIRCPQCNSDKVTYLVTARLWKCRTRHAKQKFSAKTGTVFEHSSLALEKLFIAIWVIVNCETKPSSYALASILKISQKSALRLMNCVQAAIRVATSKPSSAR